MRSRVVKTCSAVVVLLGIVAVSGVFRHWSSRATSVSPVILVDGGQAQSIQNEITERVGDLPAALETEHPALQLQFIDEEKGWFAAGGKLWRTEDRGKTWLLVHDASPKRITEFQFVGPQIGWMIADQAMFKTKDRGSTWEAFSQPIPRFWEGSLINFKFLEDGVRGWVAGGLSVPLRQMDLDDEGPPTRYLTPGMKKGLRGVIFYTDDGGKTWRRQLLASWGLLSLASLPDPAHLSATGTAGAFYLRKGQWKPMHDGGVDEEGLTRVKSLDVEIGFPTDEPLCVFFLNDRIAWISNSNGYVAKSSDGGSEWLDVCSPIGERDGRPICFSRLFFIDEVNGFGFGSDGKLYVTKDGGGSWLEQKLDILLTDVYFVDHKTVWASAKEGLLRIKL